MLSWEEKIVKCNKTNQRKPKIQWNGARRQITIISAFLRIWLEVFAAAGRRSKFSFSSTFQQTFFSCCIAIPNFIIVNINNSN